MSVGLRLPKECRKYVNHFHDTHFIVISFYGMFAPIYAYYHKKPSENTCSVSAFSRWLGNMLSYSKDRNYVALLVILKIVCTPERSCAGTPLQSCSQQPLRFFCPQYVTAPLEFMHQTRKWSMMPLEVKTLHSSLNQLLDCCEPCFISSILKDPDVLQRGTLLWSLFSYVHQ